MFHGLGRARTSVFQPELLLRYVTVTASFSQDEGSEDLEAGYAGAPFVQPEHEEEWMEWVDWAQVEGQASGSSSNLAAMFDGHFVSVGF